MCYAAEAEAGSDEVYADEQSDGDIELAFYQQGSVDRYFTFSELGVTMKIRLNYEWDEGDAGHISRLRHFMLMDMVMFIRKISNYYEECFVWRELFEVPSICIVRFTEREHMI